MKGKLRAEDWLSHGLNTLAHEGPEGLKADTMAKSLGVSRGSFYWHFKGIRAFRAALLDHWKTVGTENTITELSEHTASEDRLAELLLRAVTANDRLDRAIRRWAAQDPAVQRAVTAIDARRIEYLTQLFVAAGVPADAAATRSVFVYAASLGLSQLQPAARPDLKEDEIAVIAELLKGKRRKPRR